MKILDTALNTNTNLRTTALVCLWLLLGFSHFSEATNHKLIRDRLERMAVSERFSSSRFKSHLVWKKFWTTTQLFAKTVKTSLAGTLDFDSFLFLLQGPLNVAWEMLSHTGHLMCSFYCQWQLNKQKCPLTFTFVKRQPYGLVLNINSMRGNVAK